MTDHDSRVVARRRVNARAWELGELLDWALARARVAGFASVTVACEPTGHRWRVLDQLAAQRGLALVCVQPLLVYRAREGEDLTFDKSDPKDAVIIARLAAGLHCYEPERADAVWARLRHLGARRSQLTTDATAAGEPGPGSAGVRLAGGPGRVGLAVPLCVLAGGGWRWRWAGARVTWPGYAAWARPGSRPRCAVSCPAGARPGRACGSSAPFSPRWPILPG